jgi:phosphoheptose isomerase
MHGSVPQRIVPLDPKGSPRYLHNVDDESNGQRKPELKTFYEAIAKSLGKADKILLMGTATGSSSAMEYLSAELKSRHPEIARRIVGSIVVDEKHVTDDQLLAAARAFYAKSTAPLG